MTTILVWLLVSLPVNTYSPSYAGSLHPVVIERFATVEECARVADVIRKNAMHERHKSMCIQAHIVK